MAEEVATSTSVGWPTTSRAIPLQPREIAVFAAGLKDRASQSQQISERLEKERFGFRNWRRRPVAEASVD